MTLGGLRVPWVTPVSTVDKKNISQSLPTPCKYACGLVLTGSFLPPRPEYNGWLPSVLGRGCVI